MKRLTVAFATLALMLIGFASTTSAEEEDPPGECDPHFGECGTPDKSGGGGGGGGGAVLVANTDKGVTYQYSDDRDADGIEDGYDNCPQTKNPNQADSDGDGVGDACDNCVSVSNPDQSDIDGNSAGDKCDTDRDGDGISNKNDNCPSVPNPPLPGKSSQPDVDGDGVGDACDDDIDGDGIPNDEDPCPANANIETPEGNQSTCFPDKDGDGIPDVDDVCPRVANKAQADMDDDGVGDTCDPDIDGDGFQDNQDNCSRTPNPQQIDSDLDTKGDACDDNFCYVVYGDQENCLDPEGPLQAYSPSVIADTGEEVNLKLFANRRNQPMRYTWSLVSAPPNSEALLNNREGTVSVSTPFQYHYLEGDVPTFVPDRPGEYKFRVTVETVWEDRVSGNMNEEASYITTVKAEGKPMVPEDPAACSAGSNQRPLSTFLWLAVLGLGGWVIRRRPT